MDKDMPDMLNATAFERLTACAQKRNGGVCEDAASCNIGWCEECRLALTAKRSNAAGRQQNQAYQQNQRREVALGRGRHQARSPTRGGKLR